MYWAEVTNTNGCSSIDTVYLNFASIPEVNLGADGNYTVVVTGEGISTTKKIVLRK